MFPNQQQQQFPPPGVGQQQQPQQQQQQQAFAPPALNQWQPPQQQQSFASDVNSAPPPNLPPGFTQGVQVNMGNPTINMNKNEEFPVGSLLIFRVDDVEFQDNNFRGQFKGRQALVTFTITRFDGREGGVGKQACIFFSGKKFSAWTRQGIALGDEVALHKKGMVQGNQGGNPTAAIDFYVGKRSGQPPRVDTVQPQQGQQGQQQQQQQQGQQLDPWATNPMAGGQQQQQNQVPAFNPAPNQNAAGGDQIPKIF